MCCCHIINFVKQKVLPSVNQWASMICLFFAGQWSSIKFRPVIAPVGFCWGAFGTNWQRCTAWHSWDTWSSQDHQLVQRIMSRCGWTPCCLVARHPDRQNCRHGWHHQPSLLLEFGGNLVFYGQLMKTGLRGQWVHHGVRHDQPSQVYAAGRVEPMIWVLSNVSALFHLTRGLTT